MTRLLLVLACLVLVVLLLLGMRWGWRNRMMRQSGLPQPPAVPDALGEPELAPVTGLYVGTTFATSWQDRVVHAGLGDRADATLTLYRAGVLVERQGTTPVFLPRVDVREARLAPGLAGKVVGAGGLLVIGWRLGEADLDTGFRADDKSAYPALVRALNTKVDA